MAKNDDDLKLEGFDELDKFGDDLDKMGDFDFDMDSNPPAKNAREAVMNTAKDFKKSLIEETIKSPIDNLKNITKKAMPSNVTNVTDNLTDIKDTVTDTIDRNITPLKKELATTANMVNKLLPQFLKGGKIENTLKSIHAKLLDGVGSRSSRNEEAEQAAFITSSLNELFGAAEEKQAARQAIAEQIEKTRFESTNQILVKLLANSEIAKNFSTQVTDRYFRKSIELQMHQLYAAKKTNALLASSFDLFKNQFESIVKNTSLPDIIKARMSENLSFLLKQNINQSLLGSLFKKESKLGKLKERITSGIGNFISDFTSSLSMVNTLDDFADDPMMRPTAGGEAASMLKNSMVGKAAKKLQGKLLKNDTFAKFAKFAEDASDDPELIIDALKNRVNNSFTKKEGWLHAIGEQGENGLEALRSLMRVNERSSSYFTKQDLTTPAVMDEATKISINKIIPGYLSQIHAEVRAFRLGIKDTNLDSNQRLIYDYNKDKLVTNKTLKAGFAVGIDNAIRKGSSAYGMQHLYSVFTEHNPALRAVPTFKDTFSQSVVTYLLSRRAKTTYSALSDNNFFNSFPSEIVPLIRQTVNIIDKKIETEIKESNDGTSWLQTGIAGSLKTIKYSLPSGDNFINTLEATGNISAAEEMKLVKIDKVTGYTQYDQANYDKFLINMAKRIKLEDKEDFSSSNRYVDPDAEEQKENSFIAAMKGTHATIDKITGGRLSKIEESVKNTIDTYKDKGIKFVTEQYEKRMPEEYKQILSKYSKELKDPKTWTKEGLKTLSKDSKDLIEKVSKDLCGKGLDQLNEKDRKKVQDAVGKLVNYRNKATNFLKNEYTEFNAAKGVITNKDTYTKKGITNLYTKGKNLAKEAVKDNIQSLIEYGKEEIIKYLVKNNHTPEEAKEIVKEKLDGYSKTLESIISKVPHNGKLKSLIETKLKDAKTELLTAYNDIHKEIEEKGIVNFAIDNGRDLKQAAANGVAEMYNKGKDATSANIAKLKNIAGIQAKENAGIDKETVKSSTVSKFVWGSFGNPSLDKFLRITRGIDKKIAKGILKAPFIGLKFMLWTIPKKLLGMTSVGAKFIDIVSNVSKTTAENIEKRREQARQEGRVQGVFEKLKSTALGVGDTATHAIVTGLQAIGNLITSGNSRVEGAVDNLTTATTSIAQGEAGVEQAKLNKDAGAFNDKDGDGKRDGDSSGLFGKFKKTINGIFTKKDKEKGEKSGWSWWPMLFGSAGILGALNGGFQGVIAGLGTVAAGLVAIKAATMAGSFLGKVPALIKGAGLFGGGMLGWQAAEKIFGEDASTATKATGAALGAGARYAEYKVVKGAASAGVKALGNVIKGGGAAAKATSAVGTAANVAANVATHGGLGAKVKAAWNIIKGKLLTKLGKTAAGRLIAKVGTKFLPMVGWAMLAYDVAMIAKRMYSDGDSLLVACSKQLLGFNLFGDDTPVDEYGNPIKPDPDKTRLSPEAKARLEAEEEKAEKEREEEEDGGWFSKSTKEKREHIHKLIKSGISGGRGSARSYVNQAFYEYAGDEKDRKILKEEIEKVIKSDFQQARTEDDYVKLHSKLYVYTNASVKYDDIYNMVMRYRNQVESRLTTIRNNKRYVATPNNGSATSTAVNNVNYNASISPMPSYQIHDAQQGGASVGTTSDVGSFSGNGTYRNDVYKKFGFSDEMFKKHGITDPKMIQFLIAQSITENGYAGYQAEGDYRGSKNTKDNYKKYVGKLGNETLDDAYKYRGRGGTHLTGKATYSLFQKWLNKNGYNIDIMSNPDILVTNPEIGALSSIWYFSDEGPNPGAVKKAKQSIANGGSYEDLRMAAHGSLGNAAAYAKNGRSKDFNEAMRYVQGLQDSPDSSTESDSSNSYPVGSGTKGIINKIMSIAKNNAQGSVYSQSERQGKNSYDCSSFVTRSAIEAGLTGLDKNNYTGSMIEDYQKNGFKFFKLQPGNKETLAKQLEYGDVLMANGHTEFFAGTQNDKPMLLGAGVHKVGLRKWWDGFKPYGFLRLMDASYVNKESESKENEEMGGGDIGSNPTGELTASDVNTNASTATYSGDNRPTKVTTNADTYYNPATSSSTPAMSNWINESSQQPVQQSTVQSTPVPHMDMSGLQDIMKQSLDAQIRTANATEKLVTLQEEFTKQFSERLDSFNNGNNDNKATYANNGNKTMTIDVTNKSQTTIGA